MTELEILKNLDWILSYLKGKKKDLLYNNKGDAIIEIETGKKNHSALIMQNLKINSEQFVELIDILLSEGFVKIYLSDNTENYAMNIRKIENYRIIITLKGTIFEGFEKRQARLNLEAHRIKARDLQLKTLSWIAAFGTSGLLIWEIVKYLLEKHCYCHSLLP